MTKKKAIIVGSGIAGISVAIRLAKQGFDVTVYEKNGYAGGKLTETEFNGFRFDAGPSLLTMPYLIDELFELCNEPVQQKFKYKKFDIACNYFYHDGTTFSAYQDHTKLLAEMKKKLGLSDIKLSNYLKKIAKIWKTTAPIFLYQSLHKLKTYLSLKTFVSALKLPFIGIHKSMHEVNTAKLGNKYAIQYFNRYATYNGSNPYSAPATLNVIAYPEHFEGAYYPEKGMISITESLLDLAKAQGVTFIFNQKVDEIIIKDKLIQGVIVNNELKNTDILVSNCDIFNTYKYLLPNIKIPNKIAKQERSSSAFIFYWGINTTFKELESHNIFFSKDYKSEFDDIWKNKIAPKNPTVYVNISAKYNATDAPKGNENWFVMINVPSNLEIDWAKECQNIKDSVIKLINKSLKTDILPHIIAEKTLSPADIATKTFTHQGALYGAASNHKMAAFFRQSNKIKPFKNLYCCGGSVHPGGGIPLCLLSAKITAELIETA